MKLSKQDLEDLYVVLYTALDSTNKDRCIRYANLFGRIETAIHARDLTRAMKEMSIQT